MVHWNAFSARDNGSILRILMVKRWALDLRGGYSWLNLLTYTFEHTIPCPSCVHALWFVGWMDGRSVTTFNVDQYTSLLNNIDNTLSILKFHFHYTGSSILFIKILFQNDPLLPPNPNPPQLSSQITLFYFLV